MAFVILVGGYVLWAAQATPSYAANVAGGAATLPPAALAFAGPATPTAAPTLTATATLTPTLTLTPTATATRAVATTTLTVSPTATASPTATMRSALTPAPLTPTSARTPTVVITPTTALTLSVTSTPKVSLTPAVVRTGTPSVTTTAFLSPTATRALTVTAVVTMTIPPTATRTATTSPTPPATPASVGANAAPQPTPTAPPALPTNVPGALDPHVGYSAGADQCAACHRSHTAAGRTLRSAWSEEGLCFVCHTNGGSGTNVQPAFTGSTNTATRFFNHPVGATSGAHQRSESAGGAFGGANRHVECEDCHDPHRATRGAANAPMLQRTMTNSSGADPLWGAAGAPAGYVFLPQAQREYQVCFKCHSGFTTLPTYAPDGWDGAAFVANGLPKLTSASAQQVRDSRDLAAEFNPSNASFHPVAVQGRNQAIPAGSWVAGWSQSSMVYCSDCHGNAAAATQGTGPHGSALLHLLVGSANYTTVTAGRRPTSQELCFKCHSANVYLSGSSSATNFRKGSDNLHTKHIAEGATCYRCHDTHGSEQEYLLNFEIGPRLSVPAGRNSQTAWFRIGGQKACSLTCHGEGHNGDSSADYRYP